MPAPARVAGEGLSCLIILRWASLYSLVEAVSVGLGCTSAIISESMPGIAADELPCAATTGVSAAGEGRRERGGCDGLQGWKAGESRREGGEDGSWGDGRV
jgi:hypothetical protein